MKPGDLVQHRSGQSAPALVLKIDGHQCAVNSTVTVLNTDGEKEQLFLAQLQIINHSHNLGQQ